MDRMARMSNTRPDLGPQRYERSKASFAGTSRSIETRVTSGHSDSSTHSTSPRPAEVEILDRQLSATESEGRDSASIYDRDLPAPPQGVESTARPFSSATQDAEELVAAYSHDRDSVASVQDQGADPYDGLADDEDTTDGHQPPNTAHTSPDATAKTLPKLYIVSADKSSHVEPVEQEAMAVRKPLRNVSQGSRDDQRTSKPLPSPCVQLFLHVANSELTA